MVPLVHKIEKKVIDGGRKGDREKRNHNGVTIRRQRDIVKSSLGGGAILHLRITLCCRHFRESNETERKKKLDPFAVQNEIQPSKWCALSHSRKITVK